MNKKSANKAVFRFVRVSFSILILLVIFIGVFRATSTCYEFGYRIFTEKPMSKEPGTDIVVELDAKDSAFDVGKMLEAKGLIRDASLYVAQYYLSAYKGDLIPGTYTLNTSMTTKEMLIVMATKPQDAETEKK